jgi:ribokinase
MFVLGMGYLILERIIKVERIPKKNEMGKIISIEEYPSGYAANVIANLSKLDINTGFIGKVGSDPEGSFLIEDMMYHSVDTKNIVLSEGKSGISIKIIDSNGRSINFENLGVNTEIRLDEIKEIKEPDIFYTTTLHEKSFETQKKMLEILKDKKIFLSLEKHENRYKDLLMYADFIIFNSHSWTKYEKRFYEKILKEILLKDKKVIIKIKNGIYGSAFWDGEKFVLIKNNVENVFDASGTGEAFDTGIIFGIIKKENIEKCCEIGNLFAKECSKYIGPRSWFPKAVLKSFNI